MSTTVKLVNSAPAAAKHIAEALRLEDQKRVATALAIAAAEEVEYNPVFAERIRQAYNRLPATATRAKPVGPKALSVTLVPVKRVEGFEFDTAAPLNPYLVYEAFGAHQLRTALDLFSVPKLQGAARMVMERNPKTKPQNMRAKGPLVDYIEQYVARH